MDETPNLSAYLASLQEIKRRYEVISLFMSKKRDAKYEMTSLETIILQFRIVFELIPLASLAAHSSIYEENQKKFHKGWKPRHIIRDLKRINPHFYPEPIVEVPPNNAGEHVHLKSMNDGFLTCEELLRAHGLCGNLLHARNPFGKQPDYDFFQEITKDWASKIVQLLSVHKIMLLNTEQFHLIHLDSKPDGEIRHYVFKAIGPA